MEEIGTRSLLKILTIKTLKNFWNKSCKNTLEFSNYVRNARFAKKIRHGLCNVGIHSWRSLGFKLARPDTKVHYIQCADCGETVLGAECLQLS